MAAGLRLSLRTLCILLATAVLSARDSISMYDAFALLGRDAVVSRLAFSVSKMSKAPHTR